MADEEKEEQKEEATANSAAAANAAKAKEAAAPEQESALSQEDVASLVQQGDEAGADASPMTLTDLGGGDAGGHAGSIDMLMDVTLNVRIELGRTHMSVEDILKLGNGAVVPLDRLAGDFVDVLVNDRLVARGEVLILNDNFCVRIAEIVSPEERENASGL